MDRQSGVLDTLAPIVVDDEGYSELVAGVVQADFDDALSLQAIALAPAFDVLGDVLGKGTGVLSTGLSGDALGRFFTRIGRRYGFVQTQVPVIIPQVYKTYKAKNFKQRMTPALEAVGLTLDMVDGEFGRHSPNMIAGKTSTFGFISITRGQGKNKRLFALPYVGIDPPVLGAMAAHPDGIKALQSFQQVMGAVNHDYYHQMTAASAGPYSSVVKSTFNGIFSRYADARFFGGIFESLGNQEKEYERLGLVSHKAMFLKRYDTEPAFRDELHGHIKTFFEGVAVAKDLPNSDNPDVLSYGKVVSYMSQLMVTHLYRVIDTDHPLMQETRAEINRLVKFNHEFMVKQIGEENCPEGMDSGTFIDRQVQSYVAWDHKRIHDPDMEAQSAQRLEHMRRALKVARAGLTVAGG